MKRFVLDDAFFRSLDSSACDVNEAETLPPEIYISEEFFEFEKEAVFNHEWLCVARESWIPNPGDFYTSIHIGEPIVVVRGKDGAINAMSTVCQHRGMLVAEGHGNARNLICPYHHWTYSLEGDLVSAPAMNKARGFDPSCIKLPRFKVETWNGFIFVNFDLDAPPLSPRLTVLTDALANFRLETAEGPIPDPPTKFPWNWKVMMENNNDGYHANKLHAGPLHDVVPSHLSVFPELPADTAGYFRFNGTRHKDASFNPLHKSLMPVFPALTEEERNRFLFGQVPPTLSLVVRPDQLTYMILHAVSAKRADDDAGLARHAGRAAGAAVRGAPQHRHAIDAHDRRAGSSCRRADPDRSPLALCAARPLLLAGGIAARAQPVARAALPEGMAADEGRLRERREEGAGLMAKTVVVARTGGPEVMTFVDVDPGKPGPGEVLLRQTAIGVNFADIHYRRGTAPAHAMAKLVFPFTPGLEATGIIETVGPGVTGLRPGDRVAYATATLTTGAYTEARLFPAERIIKLPPGVSDEDVAALLYRGITVHGMIRQCYRVKPGDVVLLHAAAGGVGSVLAGWAKHLGARVIGTVSGPGKVERARQQGCDDVIVTDREDFVARARALTGGRGVDVVYDGVGRDTFVKSFACIRRYGMMVSFGHSSGMIEPFDPILLQHEGLYLTRFSGSTYNDDTAEYQMRAKEVLEAIEAGVIRRAQHAIYPLSDIVRAHSDLENRRTVGSPVLRP